MQSRKNFDRNEFEGKIKITGFPSKDAIIEKIDNYLSKYKTNETENIYDIENETSSSILLNFHKNTEIANFINRKLKLLQITNDNYSKLNCHVTVNVISPNQNEKKDENKDGKEAKEKSPKENKVKKKNKYEIYNIDTKNNPKMNKLIGKSLNFSKRNINKYLSPENNKMKIYESIFLGGPYLEKAEYERAEARKNKAQWINKKGFNQYISKQTILKNSHMIENYLSLEPAQDNNFNFRPIQKTKWVGKTDFFA